MKFKLRLSILEYTLYGLLAVTTFILFVVMLVVEIYLISIFMLLTSLVFSSFLFFNSVTFYYEQLIIRMGIFNFYVNMLYYNKITKVKNAFFHCIKVETSSGTRFYLTPKKGDYDNLYYILNNYIVYIFKDIPWNKFVQEVENWNLKTVSEEQEDIYYVYAYWKIVNESGHIGFFEKLKHYNFTRIDHCFKNNFSTELYVNYKRAQKAHYTAHLNLQNNESLKENYLLKFDENFLKCEKEIVTLINYYAIKHYSE